MDVYLNDTLVMTSSNNYPFRAYVDTVLIHGAGMKNIQLTSQLWYKNTAGHMHAMNTDGGNTDLVERRRHISESRVVEIMAGATSTCFPPPVNKHRTKGTSCRAMTMVKAAPSSVSI